MKHKQALCPLLLSLSLSALCGWAGPLALAQLSSASVPQAQAELIYPSAVQSNLNKHISPARHLEALSRRSEVQRRISSPLSVSA